MNKTSAPDPDLTPDLGGTVGDEAPTDTPGPQSVDLLIERLQADLLDQGLDPGFVHAELLALRRDTHDRLTRSPSSVTP